MNKIKALAGFATLGAMGVIQGSAGAATQNIYDNNGNGVYDALVMDRWEDGTFDIGVFDNDENGIADNVVVDINNDAWLEVALYDTNQNGVIDMYRWDTDFLEGWENVALDLNENGTNDGYEHLFSPTYWPSAPAAVGSIYSPTGLSGAMETTADMLGPWFSSADWDGDLTPDYRDYYPGDSSCNSVNDAC